MQRWARRITASEQERKEFDRTYTGEKNFAGRGGSGGDVLYLLPAVRYKSHAGRGRETVVCAGVDVRIRGREEHTDTLPFDRCDDRTPGCSLQTIQRPHTDTFQRTRTAGCFAGDDVR